MRSDAVYHGLNFDKEQDRYVRCARCGFPCKLDRDISAPNGSRAGWGINYVVADNSAVNYDQPEVSYDAIDAIVPGAKITDSSLRNYDNSEAYDSSYVTYNTFSANDGSLSYDSVKRIYDPVVTAGCPQCGCLTYNK